MNAVIPIRSDAAGCNGAVGCDEGFKAFGVIGRFDLGSLGLGHLHLLAFNRKGFGFAPFGQIGIGIFGADFHRTAVDGLFKAFGQLDLGSRAAFADDDLGGDVAPVNDDNVGHRCDSDLKAADPV